MDDLVDGMLRMMDTPAAVTGPLNLGNPNEVTMIELAETVLSLTGSRSRLVFQPLPEDDPRRRRPDITLARETLAWSPRVALADGLTETVAYFRRSLSL